MMRLRSRLGLMLEGEEKVMGLMKVLLMNVIVM